MTVRVTSYMRRILEQDEKAVCKGGLHWVYLASGMFWCAALAAMGWGADYGLWHYFGQYIPRYAFESELVSFKLERNAIGILFTACGLVILLTQYLRYIATGILVTTRRVIYKIGLVNVRIDGTDISDIRGVHVDQGWIGRFLNYGKIRLDNRFIADVHLPFVADPYRITRMIQKIKTELEGRDEEFRAPNTEPVVATQPQPVVHQTIIQIGDTDKRHVIHQADDKTIVIDSVDHIAAPKVIEHVDDDEIRDDFNKSA